MRKGREVQLAPLQERVAAVEAALVAQVVFAGRSELLEEFEGGEFSDHRLKAAWERLQAILRETGSVDELSVASDPGIPQGLLNRIAGLAGAETLGVVQEFRAAQALRRGVGVCESGAAALGRTRFEGDAVVEALARVGAAVSATAGSVRRPSRPTLLDAAEELLAAEQAGDSVRFGFGIPDLDRRLSGGLAPGELAVIAARSGHGKSALALQLGLRAAEAGSRVLVVSAEMLAREVVGRLVAARNAWSLGDLRARVRQGDAEAVEAVRAIAELSIDVDDQTRHVDGVVARLERAAAEDRPYAAVIVDYLQLMAGPGEERHEQLEAIAYGLKYAAMRLGLAVVTPVQPNRQGATSEKFVSMSQLRGSSGIENAADVILSVVREDGMGNGFGYPVFMRLEKVRNGRPGGLGGKYELGAGTFLVRQHVSEERDAMSIEAIR